MPHLCDSCQRPVWVLHHDWITTHVDHTTSIIEMVVSKGTCCSNSQESMDSRSRLARFRPERKVTLSQQHHIGGPKTGVIAAAR